MLRLLKHPDRARTSREGGLVAGSRDGVVGGDDVCRRAAPRVSGGAEASRVDTHVWPRRRGESGRQLAARTDVAGDAKAVGLHRPARQNQFTVMNLVCLIYYIESLLSNYLLQ